MTRYGYHASHEQHAPSALLHYVRLAAESGFSGVLAADHYHPWLEENGHSGFVWSWLGAALHATTCTFGTVNAPGDRYHPAVIAQASATLAELFPGRFWLAIGSGEALNEHVTGREWPSRQERRQRLRECADIIRALWRGETVTHHGLVDVDDARVYTLPDRAPQLLCAAVSEETAEWAGGWADGVITTGRPRQEMMKFIEAFHRGGGEEKRIAVQHVLSWAPTDEEARRSAWEQWRFAALPPDKLWELRTPGQFEAASQHLTVDDIAKKIPATADLGRHLEWLRDYAMLGVDDVYIFNVDRDQERFIDRFGAEVLPQLR